MPPSELLSLPLAAAKDRAKDGNLYSGARLHKEQEDSRRKLSAIGTWEGRAGPMTSEPTLEG